MRDQDFQQKQSLDSTNLLDADIIGMTLGARMPACKGSAQICYVSISTVTDYDVWAEKPVTAKEVMDTLSKNVQTTKKTPRRI